MMKKKFMGILLIGMIVVTFSALVLAASVNPKTYSATNLLTSSSYYSQVNDNDIGVKQGSFKLVTSLDAYYIQESGDYMVFMVIAATPNGLVPGISIGNGSTGWHYGLTDWYMPFVPMDNLEGNVTLFIYGALVKSVWPSGLRIVDECFGLVGLLTPLTNGTVLPYRVTANGNMHMILILTANATAV